jgi:hypothetical protein
MDALHEEAMRASGPRYVYLRTGPTTGLSVSGLSGPTSVIAVHEPVASFHSALVRAAISNPLASRDSGGPITLTVYTGHEALRRVVSWMYECRDEPQSIRETMEIMSVASYMQMPELEGDCSLRIETWARSVTEADFVQCAELWMMLATTSIAGPIELVQATLVHMLMQRPVDDPVVVALLEAVPLEPLKRLTIGACAAFAIDLALTWRRSHGDPTIDVLDHIQIEALPRCFVETLVTRFSFDRPDRPERPDRPDRPERPDRPDRPLTKEDEIQVTQRLESLSLLSFTIGCVIDTTFGWAGLFDCRFGSVKLVAEPSAQEPWRLYVRPLGNIPTYCAMQHDVVAHTPQALLVDGRIFTFGLLAPRVCEQVQATGYVYSEFDSRWHPYGVVPRCMYEASFGAVVYGTSIYFVRMAGSRVSAPCVSFDVATCAWTVRPGMTFARSWPCIAIMDGLLYVIGGTPSAPTERMCLRSGAWEIIGLQVSRYRSAAVTHGDRIYVLGGYFRRHRNYQPPRSVQHVSSAVTYITASGAFGRTADMPVPRAGHGAFVSANQIVVLGGSLLARQRAGPRVTDNEAADRFDVASGTWYQLDVDREDPDVAGWLTDAGLS